MRNKFESLQYGCPWIIITGQRPKCWATDLECWYHVCAVLYWLQNLTSQSTQPDDARTFQCSKCSQDLRLPHCPNCGERRE